MPDNLLQRDASGRLTFEMFRLPADEYPAASASVAKEFGLAQRTSLVIGLDVMFQDYQRGEQLVGLEWDIWSGFMVVAKNPASESLVRDIAVWLLQND